MIINVSEAKAKLSQLIDMVYHGEKVVIAKNNLPIVDLLIHQPRELESWDYLKDKLIWLMISWMKVMKSMPCFMVRINENNH